jgi:hypothetical protein
MIRLRPKRLPWVFQRGHFQARKHGYHQFLGKDNLVIPHGMPQAFT